MQSPLTRAGFARVTDGSGASPMAAIAARIESTIALGTKLVRKRLLCCDFASEPTSEREMDSSANRATRFTQHMKPNTSHPPFVLLRQLSYLAWVFTMACLPPGYVAARQGINQQTADAVARAQAQSQTGTNPNSVAAVMANIEQMKTVPFSEAPKPSEAGKGWYCYEYRTLRQAEAPQTSSYCKRTLDQCRASAAGQAQSPPSQARIEVGGCTAQAAAHCSYVWGPEEKNGDYHCHSAASDCRPFTFTNKGGATKQSECGELR